MDVTITTNESTTTLHAPYNPDLPTRAKEIGGRFNRADKSWSFDARDEQRVRDLAKEIYGTDGSSESVDIVTVRVNVDHWNRELGYQRGGDALRICGRLVAERRERDRPVKLGPGVVLIEGGFGSSGGSVKNPTLNHQDDTILEIRDVPAGHPELAEDRVQIVDDGAAEEAAEEATEEATEGPDVEALHAEREKLLARLAEIDEQLPAPEGTTASTREAAQILGVSVRTVQRWAASGRVDASKDEAGRWVITVTVAA